MKINLKTNIKAPMQFVYQRMDRELFEYLLPPGASVINFEGSRKGNIVHLKIGFPFWTEWISEITEDFEDDYYCYFIDVGKKTPSVLKEWNHKHWVHKNGEEAIIEDDINFSSGNLILDFLMYPFLYLSFLPRIFQYKSYFHKKFEAQPN